MPNVVTPTAAAADLPPESVIVTVHAPAATEVTENVALGPVPVAGATVAIPAHVSDSVKRPA
jgi:hypothetical protein